MQDRSSQLLAWVVALSLLSVSVHADESPRAQADQLFVQGSAAWESGDYLIALEKFDRAYAIFPSPNLRYNMGRVLSDLGRDLEALEAFEEFLAKVPDAPERARAVAKAKVEVLEKRVAHLIIHCKLAGAQITVDGRTIGSAPIDRPVRISMGAHQIAAQSPGYATALSSVSARPGETLQAEVTPREMGADSKPLKKRWWFWAALTGVAAVAATSVALGVVYGQPSDPKADAKVVSTSDCLTFGSCKQ